MTCARCGSEGFGCYECTPDPFAIIARLTADRDAALAQVSAAFEAAADLLDAYSEYDQQYCCNGHMCGCQGETVHQMMQHFIRALTPADATAAIARLTADRDAWSAESADNLRNLVEATARIDAMRDDIITLGAQVNSLMRERDDALAQVAGAYEAAARVTSSHAKYTREAIKTATAAALVTNLITINETRTAHFIEDKIRALTPDDAAAALDRIKRQARIEGLQQAYDLSGGYHQVTHIRAAILAAIKGEEQQ